MTRHTDKHGGDRAIDNMFTVSQALEISDEVFSKVREYMSLFPQYEGRHWAPETIEDAQEFVRQREEEAKKASKSVSAVGTLIRFFSG